MAASSEAVGMRLLAGANATALALYAVDKAAARRSRFAPRVPEKVLHCVEMAGGAPAAFVGQRLFNHKSAKRAYQREFLAIVVAQSVFIHAVWGRSWLSWAWVGLSALVVTHNVTLHRKK